MKRRKRIVTPTAPTDVLPTDVFAPAPATYRVRVMRLTPMLERLRALALLQHLRLRLHQHTKKVEIQFMTELAQKYGLVAWEEVHPVTTDTLPAGSASPGYDGQVTAVPEMATPPMNWLSLVLMLTLAVACNALFLFCLRRPCFMKREKPVIVVPTDPPEMETIVLQILDDPEDYPSPIEDVLRPEGGRSPSVDSRADSAILAASGNFGSGSGDFGSGSGEESPLSPSLLRAFPPPYEDDPPPPYNALVQYKPDSAPLSPSRPPQYTPRAASPLSSASEISYSVMSAAGTPWPPPADLTCDTPPAISPTGSPIKSPVMHRVTYV